jgi:hypothetical protein
MKTWKKFALLNVACLIGIGLSVLILPGSTLFWQWATIALVTVALFNFLAYRTIRRAPAKSKMDPGIAALGWIGVGFFLVEIFFHFFHR